MDIFWKIYTIEFYEYFMSLKYFGDEWFVHYNQDQAVWILG